MNSDPVQLLETAIYAGCYTLKGLCTQYATPGSIIAAMSEANRKILADLRSADIATLRNDVVQWHLPDRCPLRQLALSFDASIPKYFRHY